MEKLPPNNALTREQYYQRQEAAEATLAAANAETATWQAEATLANDVKHPGSLAVNHELDDDDPEAWMQRATCRGTNPGDFFPTDGVGVDAVRRVCEGCPVRAECLEYALTYRIEHGVWGGASERERRRIQRRRRILG